MSKWTVSCVICVVTIQFLGVGELYAQDREVVHDFSTSLRDTPNAQAVEIIEREFESHSAVSALTLSLLQLEGVTDGILHEEIPDLDASELQTIITTPTSLVVEPVVAELSVSDSAILPSENGLLDSTIHDNTPLALEELAHSEPVLPAVAIEATSTEPAVLSEEHILESVVAEVQESLASSTGISSVVGEVRRAEAELLPVDAVVETPDLFQAEDVLIEEITREIVERIDLMDPKHEVHDRPRLNGELRVDDAIAIPEQATTEIVKVEEVVEGFAEMVTEKEQLVAIHKHLSDVVSERLAERLERIEELHVQAEENVRVQIEERRERLEKQKERVEERRERAAERKEQAEERREQTEERQEQQGQQEQSQGEREGRRQGRSNG